MRTQFLKYNGFIPDNWQSFVGQKVTIKIKDRKRWRLKQGFLQITDKPFGCDCCPWGVAALVSPAGVIKWSSSPGIRAVGQQWL
jgi:hypothetical protein